MHSAIQMMHLSENTVEIWKKIDPHYQWQPRDSTFIINNNDNNKNQSTLARSGIADQYCHLVCIINSLFFICVKQLHVLAEVETDAETEIPLPLRVKDPPYNTMCHWTPQVHLKGHLAGRTVQHGPTTPLGLPGTDWGGDPPAWPGMRERESAPILCWWAVKKLLTHSLTSVPAKWHINPLNGLSRVHECDRRQTDRPRYGEVCSYRWNRLC